VFKFPLDTINTVTLSLLFNALSLAARNTGNTIYLYLSMLLGDELSRREKAGGAIEEIDTLIILPLGDSTGEQVNQAAGFVAIALKPLDKREPVAWFLDAILLEIQSAAYRLQAAATN
jgi:hypothetical protein